MSDTEALDAALLEIKRLAAFCRKREAEAIAASDVTSTALSSLQASTLEQCASIITDMRRWPDTRNEILKGRKDD